MANGLYKLYKEACLTGSGHASYVAWVADNIKLLFATSGYTVNLSTDQFVSVIGGGNIVARSGNFSGKSATLGTANASNVTVTAVSGSAIQSVIIYKDAGGADSGNALIAYIDTATGLPVTPNGGDIIVAWDTGTNKIYTL